MARVLAEGTPTSAAVALAPFSLGAAAAPAGRDELAPLARDALVRWRAVAAPSFAALPAVAACEESSLVSGAGRGRPGHAPEPPDHGGRGGVRPVNSHGAFS
jgi:hypothetical protein